MIKLYLCLSLYIIISPRNLNSFPRHGEAKKCFHYTLFNFKPCICINLKKNKCNDPFLLYSFEIVCFSDYERNICCRNVRSIEHFGNDKDKIKSSINNVKKKANSLIISSFYLLILYASIYSFYASFLFIYFNYTYVNHI